MANWSSLYIRLSVSPDNYRKMLASQVASPMEYMDWQRWVSNKNQNDCGQISVKCLTGLSRTTLADLLEFFQETMHGVKAVYDDQDQLWQLGVLMFPADIVEMVPYIAALRGSEAFKNQDNPDFMVIYPRLWKGGNDACLLIKHGSSKFVETLSETQMEEADAFLDTLVVTLSAEDIASPSD